MMFIFFSMSRVRNRHTRKSTLFSNKEIGISGGQPLDKNIEQGVIKKLQLLCIEPRFRLFQDIEDAHLDLIYIDFFIDFIEMHLQNHALVIHGGFALSNFFQHFLGLEEQGADFR